MYWPQLSHQVFTAPALDGQRAPIQSGYWEGMRPDSSAAEERPAATDLRLEVVPTRIQWQSTNPGTTWLEDRYGARLEIGLQGRQVGEERLEKVTGAPILDATEEGHGRGRCAPQGEQRAEVLSAETTTRSSCAALSNITVSSADV